MHDVGCIRLKKRLMLKIIPKGECYVNVRIDSNSTLEHEILSEPRLPAVTLHFLDAEW
jgi:hypothetical protein